MKQYVDTDFYRRHLPHYQPYGTQYFVTIRLAGSLPCSVVVQLKSEYDRLRRGADPTGAMRDRLARYQGTQRAYFERFDGLLDGSNTGPLWLQNPQVATIVSDSTHYLDGKVYDLLCFTIMFNHVHLIIDMAQQAKFEATGGKPLSVTKIMASLKSFTAHEANKVLKRTGAFWQGESYDHVIRNFDELQSSLSYVVNNAVKAGLVDGWHKWPWTYCKPGLL